ncbi:MAG: xanthine dehydrogenase family protein molybdopterin-binding subunit [Chloroflexi bacterium]|nr:xanthine dehydrogenase family protein molybdopterin-binding subunit [Chloroflexota bacterium]
MGWFGASVRRQEDPRLLTGRGRYVADIRRADALHLAVLRSPHAHARVVGIDVSAARRAPGVVDIVTAADLGSVRPIPVRLSPLPSLVACLQYPLARDCVRYVGDPVAAIVAGDRYQAEDARELVRVHYEPLRPVVDAAEGLVADAPLVHTLLPTNVVAEWDVQVGDVQAAFAEADLVVREELRIQRHTGVPLETRGLTAEFDAGRGVLTMWGPTKVPHFNRGVLAGLLELPEHRVHLVEPEVGGGFGVRGELYPEDFLVPFLAMRIGRPVAWVEDRLEHLVATNHSRQQVHQIELALRCDGTILAMRDRFLNDQGAYVRTHGVTVAALTSAMLPGPYRIPAYRSEVACVLTNKTPTGTYRGPGRFEATFVRERALDLAAERLGLDPVEIRRRNFIPPEAMPYDVGTAALDTPIVFDSGAYGALLDRALERFDYPAWRLRQREARVQGRLVGIGIGCFVEKTGLGPYETARIEIDLSGGVVLYSGIANLGQGMETTLAQICAEHLGIDPASVTVVHGDTAVIPHGGGAFASRGAVMAGNAADLAARQLREKLLALGAHRLEAAPSDLELVDGRVRVAGAPERGLSFAELARAALPGQPLPPGVSPLLDETAHFETTHMTYPYGVHLAAVEVDGETGQLEILAYLIAYDVGRAINPMLVEGQLVGGAAQGIGGTLLEELRYDEAGQLVSATFMDYLLPTSAEVPHIDILLTEDAPSPLNPLGIKGAGEGGTVGAPAVLANAVSDAIGVSVRELPLTPDRVLEMVRKSRM